MSIEILQNVPFCFLEHPVGYSNVQTIWKFDLHGKLKSYNYSSLELLSCKKRSLFENRPPQNKILYLTLLKCSYSLIILSKIFI